MSNSSNDKPLVSVLMPVYNTAPFLSKALEGVLSQTHENFELIVVDDGSTDDAVNILARYASRDRRVRILRLAHVGIARARNAALRMAQGAFAANNDSDDISLPDRLARQLDYLQRHPECVAVGCQTLFVDADGDPIQRLTTDLEHEQIVAGLLHGRGLSLVHSSMMLRRGAAERVGYYAEELEIGEDLDLYLKLAEIGRLANLPEILLRVTRHASSTSFSQSQSRTRDLRESIVRRALTRRGLPADNVEVLCEQQRHFSDNYLEWIRAAYRNGYYATAIKYSHRVIARNLFVTRMWRDVFPFWGKSLLRQVIPARVFAKLRNLFK
jgi:glycosyltransferase involved in cell wall biosynthesis